MTSVLTVAADHIQIDLEEGQLAAKANSLDDEDLGPMVHDQVGDGFPSQEAFFAVQGRSVWRRLELISGESHKNV